MNEQKPYPQDVTNPTPTQQGPRPATASPASEGAAREAVIKAAITWQRERHGLRHTMKPDEVVLNDAAHELDLLLAAPAPAANTEGRDDWDCSICDDKTRHFHKAIYNRAYDPSGNNQLREITGYEKISLAEAHPAEQPPQGEREKFICEGCRYTTNDIGELRDVCYQCFARAAAAQPQEQALLTGERCERVYGALRIRSDIPNEKAFWERFAAALAVPKDSQP